MAKNKTVQTSAVKEFSLKPIMTRWLGVLCFLVPVCFFLQTHDSATIKIVIFLAGVFGLSGLWFAACLRNRAQIFTKQNFKTLLPFALYFIYVCASFFFQPYAFVRTEAFVSFIAASLLFAFVIFELDSADIYRLVSAIIFTCWFVYGYGLLQIINNYLFAGADPLFWTDYFGKRVFSTIANPNFFADFCLLTLALIAARFAYAKQKKLLVLAALGIVNIFFSESKGAWAALAVCTVAFGFVYLNYFTALYQKHRAKFNIAAFIVLAAAVFVVGVFAQKRMQSVNFRVATWQATVQMIKDKPIFGRGLGSFEHYYPAYKHADIFYMEPTHNAQTEHAENYYLEQFSELGLFGFLLFAWCFAAVAIAVVRKLKQYNHSAKEAAANEAFYTLLGCAGAAGAVYVHNFVDVSIYFASTGFFVALLSAAAFNLSGGRLSCAVRPRQEGKGFALLSALLAAFFFFACALYARGDFAFFISFLPANRPLFFIIYWLFFIFCAFGAAAVLSYAAFKVKNVFACIALVFFGGLMLLFFNIFRADGNLAFATKLAEEQDISAADYYTKVIKLAPYDAQSYVNRGTVLATALNLTVSNIPAYGDEEGKLFDDYQRAARDFDAALKLTPYTPLVYYQYGTLERAMALKLSKMPQYAQDKDLTARVGQLYIAAQKHFLRALELDPVYDNIYYQLANIALDNKNPQAAACWLYKYMRGPQQIADKKYLALHENDQKAKGYLQQIELKLTPAQIAQAKGGSCVI